MHTDGLWRPGGLRPHAAVAGVASIFGLLWNRPQWRWTTRLGLVLMLAGATTSAAVALNNRILTGTELALVKSLEGGGFVHQDQAALNRLSNVGSPSARFTQAFEQGDTEFSHQFTADEGGGAN